MRHLVETIKITYTYKNREYKSVGRFYGRGGHKSPADFVIVHKNREISSLEQRVRGYKLHASSLLAFLYADLTLDRKYVKMFKGLVYNHNPIMALLKEQPK